MDHPHRDAFFVGVEPREIRLGADGRERLAVDGGPVCDVFKGHERRSGLSRFRMCAGDRLLWVGASRAVPDVIRS